MLVTQHDKVNDRPQTTDRFLWFLMGCVPFCGGIARFPPDPAFWSDWSATTLFLTWLLSMAMRRRKAAPVAVPLALLVLPALAVLIGLQTAVGMERYPVSQVLVVATLGVAFFVGIAGRAILDSDRRDQLIDAFCAGGVAALAINAVAVVLGLWGYEVLLLEAVHTDVGVRAVGLIGQSNHLATFTVLALAGAIYLRGRGKLAPALFWLGVVANAFVCAASGSRTAIGLWVLLMLLLWLARRGAAEEDQTRRLSGGELWLMAAVFIVAQFAWIVRTESAPEVHVSVARTGGAGRAQLLLDAVQLWARHPVLGVGQGNYAQARLHELETPLTHPNAAHAHNIVAQALAEWGTVGTLAILSAGAILFWWGWRAIRSEHRLESFVVVVWIGCVLAHSLFEHPLWFMRLLLPFALMVGLLPQPSLRVPTALQRRQSGIWALLAAVGLLVCALAAWDYGRIQALTVRVHAAASSSPDGRSLVPIAAAAGIASFTMFPRYAQIQLARALPLNNELSLQKLDIAKRAMDSAPDAQTIACYLAFAVVADRQDEAKALFRSIRQRNPALYADTLRTLNDYAEVDARVRAFAEAQDRGAFAH